MRITPLAAAVLLCSTALCGCGSQGSPASPSLLPSTSSLETETLPPPPLPPPPNIVAGDYAIIFSAQNCHAYAAIPVLPEEFRTRTYSARLEQNDYDIRVVVKGSPRIAPLEDPALWGRVEDTGSMTLTNYYGNDNWDAIFERLTPETGLAIFVERMRVTISPDGLPTVGEFVGNLWIFDLKNGDGRHTCDWGSHSVRFVRR